MASIAARSKKLFVDLPKWKVLTRSDAEHSEVTVYIKGFLAEGEAVENFDDWLHSHKLLMLSPKHQWGSAALGYSWPSGTSMHQIPIPFASLGSAAYLIGRNMQQLRHLRFPSPASIFGALAIDAGLHMGRLAYQFHVATKESHERAETLAFRLLQLREKYDKIRLVGHSLGCRHIVEACSLLTPRDRPNEIHLCAPALVCNDILPMVAVGSGGIGQQNTTIYYSHKDVTLGVLFRALVAGDQAIGEIGLPDEPLDPSVLMIDASRSLGGYYVGSHTDYADKFHFMCAAPPTDPRLDPKE